MIGLDINFLCGNSQLAPKVAFFQILAWLCDDESEIKVEVGKKINSHESGTTIFFSGTDRLTGIFFSVSFSIMKNDLFCKR